MNGALTNEELVLLIQTGQNKTANTEVLYKQNRGLIASIALRYEGQAELDDLMQEGFFGLMTAVKLWNPEGGANFATYARHWIRQAMRRYTDENCSAVRLPSGKRTDLFKFQKAVNDLRMLTGREPSISEIGYKTGFSPDKIENLKKDAVFLSIRSTSEQIEEDLSLEDTIASPGDEIDDLMDEINRSERDELLWQIVNELPCDQSAVIELKYKDSLTCKQSAERLRREESQVRSSEAKAMRTLRSSKITKRLQPYLDDRMLASAYRGTGFSSFSRTHTSATERTAIFEIESDPNIQSM